MAFELSHTRWKLIFGNGGEMRVVSMDVRNLQQLQQEAEKAKKRFKLSGAIRILSCYEAGRDGFWLHRYLLSWGVENLVVGSSSIEVNRPKRCAKTDHAEPKAFT